MSNYLLVDVGTWRSYGEGLARHFGAQAMNGGLKLVALEDRPPCPITLDDIVDPVILTDGHVYERDAIATILQQPSPRSPLTNLPLRSIVQLPLNILLALTEAYISKRPEISTTRETEDLITTFTDMIGDNEMEIADLKDHLRCREDQVADLRARLEESEVEKRKLRCDIEKFRSEECLLRAVIGQKEDELAYLQARYQYVQGHLEGIDAHFAAMEEKLAKEQADRRTALADAASMRAKNKQLMADSKRVEAKLSAEQVGHQRAMADAVEARAACERLLERSKRAEEKCLGLRRTFQSFIALQGRPADANPVIAFVTVIQAHFRGRKCRQQLRQACASARRLQASFKGHRRMRQLQPQLFLDELARIRMAGAAEQMDRKRAKAAAAASGHAKRRAKKAARKSEKSRGRALAAEFPDLRCRPLRWARLELVA